MDVKIKQKLDDEINKFNAYFFKRRKDLKEKPVYAHQGLRPNRGLNGLKNRVNSSENCVRPQQGLKQFRELCIKKRGGDHE